MLKNSSTASSQQVAKRAKEVGGDGCKPALSDHIPNQGSGFKVRPRPSSNSGVAGRLATTSTGAKNHQGWRWLFTTPANRWKL